MHTSYQRRVNELKEVRAKLWNLEVSQNSILFDNKMLQEEYNKMKAKTEILEKFASKSVKVSLVLATLLLYCIATIVYLGYA